MTANFRLGVNTCFAVKRWPRPEDWARIVRDDLGLDLVQHSLDLVDLDGDPEWAKAQAFELAERCAEFDLRLHSTFTGLAAYSSSLLLHPDERARRQAEKWYRRAIDFTATAGAPATGGHVGAYSVPDWLDSERRAGLASDLRAAFRRLASYARSAGLDTLYVENMAAAREPSTMDAVAGLLNGGDDRHAAIALCLDVGHQCVPGTSGAERDPYAWLERFGGSAALVQVQQSDAEGDHHWPFTPETNRRGRIVAGEVLDVLSRVADGTVELFLEVIPPFEADDETVRREIVESVRYWRDAMR